ncbi:ferredoxin--NADP reductase [Lutibacter sp. HS1-25]|uniref:ferredoxin--NADP reductase n=1 Tax=Lutibacter sp. HS1-25 TaxID=2485000 RepID=UPI001012EC24|nr:ferredoxin--NADP reductase [Lutibacter sp. HS1-25]RXP54259.1 ferredoxin--NADP reductase [Lutibacter sp. HS1-25]
MPRFKKLTVNEIKHETSKSVSIVLDIPAEFKDEFNFIAGQYITIRITIDGKELRRSYSICSSPQNHEFRIAIKEVENGVFSNYATKKLKVGDVLEVSPPEGKFILQTATSHQKNYVAFAAGSGITPVLSMIKSVLLKETHSTFVLVYGNKTAEDTMFMTDIDALKIRYSDRFFIQYVFSKKIMDDAILGRIDKSIVNLIVKNKFKNIDFDGYFLCGPEAMIDTVTSTLKENNVPLSKIHFELFTSTYTSGAITSKNLDGNTNITVILDDEETTFEMSKKQMILTAALDEGLDAPYSCQGGICSSCLARVTEGSVVMDKNAILSKDELEEGLILTCQAHPTTDKLTINFDDV